jgi:hypothetical protein
MSYLTVTDKNVFDWVVYDLILKIELIQLVQFPKVVKEKEKEVIFQKKEEEI